jgi:hypothetical protein
MEAVRQRMSWEYQMGRLNGFAEESQTFARKNKRILEEAADLIVIIKKNGTIEEEVILYKFYGGRKDR